MSSSKPPIWIYLCLVVTAGLCLFSMSYRHRVEQRNKAVSVATEVDAVAGLAASEGLTTLQAFEKLKAEGLNSIVLSEETVVELIGQGRIDMAPTQIGLRVGRPVKEGYLLTGNGADLTRVRRGLETRFPGLKGLYEDLPDNSLLVTLQPTLLRTVSLGLNPQETKLANQVGLTIIGRFNNPVGISSEGVRRTLKWASGMGMKVLLPQGDQVLGRRDALSALYESLEQNDLLYASPEFAKIGGDANVVGKVPERVLRLHSAQSQELDKMTLADAVDRYARAYRERNQRVLLLRPVSMSAEQPLTEFANFVEMTRKDVEEHGGVIGNAHPFEESAAPAWLFALIGLSVAPIVFWTLSNLLGSKTLIYGLTALTALVGLACYKEIGRPYMALLGACTLPITAYVLLDKRNGKSVALEFIVVSLVSLIGGLCIAGLLNSLDYFVRAEQFPGVKLAHFGPLAVIGLYYFWRLTSGKDALKNPILWSQAVLSMVILAGLALMFTRTGNDNPAAVSGFELKLRSLMDAVMFVRPRTKEFMIGHPLLIVGIGMLIAARAGRQPWANSKGWIPLLLMVGAIGSTSIVNTMAHLHTTLTLSLARIAVGLVLGGIIGGILWTIVQRLLTPKRN